MTETDLRASGWCNDCGGCILLSGRGSIGSVSQLLMKAGSKVDEGGAYEGKKGGKATLLSTRLIMDGAAL